MLICATPGSVERRWPILISAYSFRVVSGRASEVSVICSIAEAPGLTFRYVGGVVISAGSLREAFAIAAWISCAAASILRSRLNCTVIRPVPRPLTDVMESTPAMAENSRSSGVAIDAAIVAGLAPGKVVVTLMVGKSTFGRAATGRKAYPTMPTSTIAHVNNVVMTGRSMQRVGSVMACAPSSRTTLGQKVATSGSKHTENTLCQHQEIASKAILRASA